MVKKTVVGMDIEEGRKFIELLQNSGVPLSAALWEKTPFEFWKLNIVTPLVEQFGIKETYRRLDHILSNARERPAIDLLNVSVLTPRASFFRDLRRVFRNARERPVNGQPVGDRTIGEGFIYFVK